MPKKLFQLPTLLVLLCFFIPASLHAQPADLEDQVRAIAAELRCPVCQNLSVADSPSELAQQMRAMVEEQLKAGKSPQEVKAFFVSKYGDWVLLAPPASGFSLLVWILPYVALAGGLIFVFFLLWRWSRRKPTGSTAQADPDLIQRIHKELVADDSWEVDPEAEGPRAPLMRERARLYAALRELEFDYQAGRLSKTDYDELRREYEEQASAVLKDLDAAPPAIREEASPAHRAGGKAKAEPASARAPRRWTFVATSAFLLIFGVTLGILLDRSVRPRGSSEDSITGDFLTGTGGTGGAPLPAVGAGSLQDLLAEGRAAFERQDWPRAIDSFKQVVAMDGDNPEAHAYMGLILAGAGHADAAMLAFNRALSRNPDYPLALWGSGMVLYRQKSEPEAARERFEKLLALLPPGADKDQLRETLLELGQGAAKPSAPPPVPRSGPGAGMAGMQDMTASAPGSVTGTISLAPGLEAGSGNRGVLFIIARAAGSQGGPPLAVKKIERPAFPVSYSLGQENTMIPGTQFRGEVNITARLDRDGNPVTQEAGDLSGAYPGNPVNVDTPKTVDIVLGRGTP